MPRSGPGRADRVTKAVRTSSIAARIDDDRRRLGAEVFTSYADGNSLGTIARQLAISKSTAWKYLNQASREFSDDHATRLEARIAQAIAVYREQIRWYRAQQNGPDARGDEGRYIMQAQTRIDRLTGLDSARIKPEIHSDAPTPATVAMTDDELGRLGIALAGSSG